MLQLKAFITNVQAMSEINFLKGEEINFVKTENDNPDFKNYSFNKSLILANVIEKKEDVDNFISMIHKLTSDYYDTMEVAADKFIGTLQDCTVYSNQKEETKSQYDAIIKIIDRELPLILSKDKKYSKYISSVPMSDATDDNPDIAISLEYKYDIVTDMDNVVYTVISLWIYGVDKDLTIIKRFSNSGEYLN